MTVQDIYFDVDFQQSNKLFNKPFAPHISHCVVRKDSGKVLHTCSNSYRLVSNKQLIEPVRNELIKRYGNDGFDTEVMAYDEVKFFVRFIIKNKTYTVQEGDAIAPVIEIGNSYNGKLRSFQRIGFYRLVCSNGLRAYSFDFGQKQKHTKNFKVNFDFLDRGLKIYDEKINHFRLLNNRQLTPDELIEFKENISRTKAFPVSLIDGVFETLIKEATQLNFKKTPWLLYNAFNKELFDADFKMHLDERIKIDKKMSTLIETLA